jgi:hypothetical protein
MLQTPRLYRLMFESEKIKIGLALLFNSDRKFSKFSRKPVVNSFKSEGDL